MSKRKPNCYVIKDARNHLAGAFPLTKKGREQAETWANELREKRKEKYQIFKM